MAVRFPGRPTFASSLRLLLTALVAVPLAVHAAALVAEVCTWRLGAGAGEIRAHCGACHEANRARDFARSPDGWKRTVEGMLDHRGPSRDVGAGERAAMVGWLVRHRSADGATLFRHRCGRCHGRSAIEPYRALGDEALTLLIRQHTRQQNHAIQAWEGEAIIGHVLAEGESPESPLDPALSREFQRTCGACHSTSFLYRAMCEPRRDGGGWETVVTRMRGKSPELFAADRVPGLARQSAGVCDPPLADL